MQDSHALEASRNVVLASRKLAHSYDKNTLKLKFVSAEQGLQTKQWTKMQKLQHAVFPRGLPPQY